MTATISTGSLIVDILIVLVSAFLAIYLYFKHAYQYWKKKGVPYLEPTFPYGNNPFLLPESPTFAGEAKLWYDELKKRGHKFGGVYAFTRHILVLVDPEYIKDVLSKNFRNFTDRDVYVNEKHDPIGTNLFSIRGDTWKSLRQKFTPTFTSGKMKHMFNTVVSSSTHMIEYLEKCDKMGDDIIVREVLASFTTDVIGSVAFGIDCNSFGESHAEFRKQGRDFFKLSLTQYMKTMLIMTFPELAVKCRIKFTRREQRDFFCQAIKDTVEYREKNNIRRADFLQILIDMNKEAKTKEKQFSFEEIVANSILFFIAGFDTSSTVMTYALYELARNPDIQEKLRGEINNVLKKHKGEVTYEAIQSMTYLQQCLNETMRIYPPVISLGRICTKDYQLRDTDITIEKGTHVAISTIALGRDPDNFPNPMQFDPERFSPEEVAKRHPYIYIPFGEGPRNCIGLRFGLMQAEIGLVEILRKFAVTTSPKTKIPLDHDLKLFLLKEKETLYLRAKKL